VTIFAGLENFSSHKLFQKPKKQVALKMNLGQKTFNRDYEDPPMWEV